MGVNKVVMGGKTLIDISDSTVSASSLLEGEKAYDAAGNLIIGEMASAEFEPAFAQGSDGSGVNGLKTISNLAFKPTAFVVRYSGSNTFWGSAFRRNETDVFPWIYTGISDPSFGDNSFSFNLTGGNSFIWYASGYGKKDTTFSFSYTGTYSSTLANGVGTIEFTSSGTLTVTNCKKTATLYLLGGGGGGGGAVCTASGAIGGGGGSGYWNTIEGLTIEPGVYEITIGTGGAGGGASYRYISALGYYSGSANPGSAGNATSAFGHSVNGGSGGTAGVNSSGTGGAGGNKGSNGTVGGAGGSPNGGAGGKATGIPTSQGGGTGGNGIVTLTFT